METAYMGSNQSINNYFKIAMKQEKMYGFELDLFHINI